MNAATISLIDAALAAAGIGIDDYLTAKGIEPTRRGLLSTAEAQIFLGSVSRQHLYAEVKAGNLTAVKIGRRQCFELSELERYVAERRTRRSAR